MKSVVYTFVCQQGQLVGEALLLAASLRRNLTFPARLAAVIPLPREIFGTPLESALRILRDLGVEVVEAVNRQEVLRG